jgi:hypothetical protein
MTYQLGRIGKETVQNGLDDATMWVATHLSLVGDKAIEKGYEETSIETANILNAMSVRACDRRIEPALESIGKCLYYLGDKSISAKLNETAKIVVEGLANTIKGGKKFDLDYIVRRAANFLIELGIIATLNKNTTSQILIVDTLFELNNMSIPEIGIGFKTLESRNLGNANNLEALSEFKDIYNRKSVAIINSV